MNTTTIPALTDTKMNQTRRRKETTMDSVMTGGFEKVLRSLALGVALLLVSGSFLAASADVSRIGAWTQPINNDTTSPYTGTVTAGASASGLRALVVTVGLDYTTQPTTNPVITANYGGQVMTQAALACAGTGSRCAGVFYLLNDGIVAAGANTTLTLTTTATGGATPNFVAYAATFDNVSQTHPIADFSTSNRATAGTTLLFGKNVAVGTGDMALYALDVDVITSAHTPPANYINQLSDTTTGHSAFIAQRSVPTTDASENLTVSFTSSIASLAVAVLNDVSFNALTSCAGCHDMPPADGTRNSPEGAVVGDHASHNFACATCHVSPTPETAVNFAHRDGVITMASPIFGGSGSYSRIAPINQSNSPVTGTCSNISCHSGAVTPQWGVGTTTCSSCHALPPNTDAHTKHYTAKSWATGVTTNCTVCHPDNNVTHSDVTDGVISVIAGLTPSGVSPAISCAASPAGCHNSQPSPAWNTTAIACIGCHTVGGAGANPTSGLHDIAAVGVQKHDNTLAAGNCINCHSATKPPSHANGIYDANSATYNDRFVSKPSMVWTDGAGDTGTCSGSGLTGCHTDSGNWSRLWSTAADSTVTTAGDARCAVCHGQFGDWRVGTSHYNTNGGAASTRGSSHNSLTGASNVCEDCHSYPTLIANHDNGQVTVNQGSWIVTRATGRTYCSNCHSNDGLPTAAGTHTFTTSTLPLQTVAGANDPVGDCAGCHGGGTTGSNSQNFWPDNSSTHLSNDQPGRHVKHMTVIARRLYNLDLTGLLNDATSATKQKAICEYCHAANTNDGDHTSTYPADVFDTSLGKKALHLNGAADANATYTPAADTCSNVDCHNSQLTVDGTFGWYDAGASTCIMCHTAGGAGNNPNSGLHTGVAPTVSGQKHDSAVSGGCVACHTALPNVTTTQTATHINGSFTSNGFVPAEKTNMGLFAAYTATADSIGSCSGAAVGGIGCHNGAGDAGSWARKWNSAIHYVTTGAECAGCHGGFNSDWTFGSVANTTDGSVEHARNWDTPQDGVAEVIGNHSNSTLNTNKCNTCHVYGDAPYASMPNASHRNGNITMNTRVTYSGTSWDCANTCHANTTNHNLEDSGWTTENVLGPAFTCVTCHPSITSHTDADGAGATHPIAGGNHCLACHTDHAVANRTGTSSANNIYIKTTYGSSVPVPTLNEQYASTSHNGYFQLGGTATSGGSEAEICWNCHNTVAVSEWGSNTNATTGSVLYDFGDLYTDNTSPGTKTSNWTTGFWRSGKGRASGSSSNPFWYKRGAIQSTHSVNFDSGTAALVTSGNSLGFGRTENKDAVANIRCSYCHDVHGTHNTVNGDVSGGAGTADAPYLRGSWRSNQYPEDGAPQYGMHNNWTIQGTATTSTTFYGRVPRAAADPNNSGLGKVTGFPGTFQAGGWWIDQNSGNPTSAITGATALDKASNSSGLCAQCHGSDGNGTWTAAEIGAINWTATGIEATQSNWVSGYNGHANSVIGGAGVADAPRARNIYTRVARGTDQMLNNTSASALTDMGLATFSQTTGRGYSYRSAVTSTATGYHWFPKTSTNTYNAASGTESSAFRTFAWATNIGGTSSARGYLWATGTKPIVMSTSTTEATHDAQANYHTFTCAKCHNPHASRLPKLMITNCLDTNHNTWEDYNHLGSTLPGIWANTRHSQWASAINCHRLDARAALTTGQTVMLGRGWNRVTPWMEFTNPNSTRANPNP